MHVHPRQKDGFEILRIEDQVQAFSDVSELKPIVKKYLDKGLLRIALAFRQDSVLSSDAISVIVKCLQMVVNRKGCLAIVKPTGDIIDTLTILGLKKKIVLVENESELKLTGESNISLFT